MAKTSGKTHGHRNLALKLQEPTEPMPLPLPLMRRPSNPTGERKFFRRKSSVREFCERAEHEREKQTIKWIKKLFTQCYSIMYLYMIL
jgi:hypothetical protein